ncbi:MAG: Hsp70 family protein, partial [Spirulinaceae cyanobacterium]
MTTVAIDFGTSNTLICLQDSTTQVPRVLQFPEISRSFLVDSGTVNVVPSLVFVQENGNLLFGEAGRSQWLQTSQTERLFTGFKRDIAAEYRSPDQQVEGKVYTPEYLIELFLGQLWQQITAQNIVPTQMILTAPVGNFERYVDLFKTIGKKLNFPQLQIVDEASAAAWGYGITQPKATILGIDFGGGTLDVSLVTVDTPDQAQIITTAEAYLGGIDIDTWIAQDYLVKIASDCQQLKQGRWHSLLAAAEKLKIQLSLAQEAEVSWEEGEISLTREELGQLFQSEGLFKQIQQVLDEVRETALRKGMSQDKIDSILLVGGSCLIPGVQEFVANYFGAERLKPHQPLEAVVRGALAFTQGTTTNNHTLSYGYGIRLWQPEAENYAYLNLFKPGIPYPCRLQKPLNLQVATAGQQEIRLDIGEMREMVQGEVTFELNNQMMQSQSHKQIEFTPLVSSQQQSYLISLQPPGELNKNRLQVRFEVDANQELVITITDLVMKRVIVHKETTQPLTSTSLNLEPGIFPSDAAVLGTMQKEIPVIESLIEVEPVVQQTPKQSQPYFDFAILATLTGHSAGVTSLAISPDGKTLVSGSQDHSLRFWQLPGGEWLRSIAVHTDAVTSLAMSGDGKMLASASKDQTVRLWHTASGACLKTFSSNDEGIFNVVFSPDSQGIAWGGWDNYIVFKNLFNNSSSRRFPGHQGGTAAIAFSPDGESLISCGDKNINAWSLNPQELIYSIQGHLDLALTLATNPDSQTLATSGGIQDKTIKLWHLSTGELIQTLWGNLDGALSLAFSPDGQI